MPAAPGQTTLCYASVFSSTQNTVPVVSDFAFSQNQFYRCLLVIRSSVVIGFFFICVFYILSWILFQLFFFFFYIKICEPKNLKNFMKTNLLKITFERFCSELLDKGKWENVWL